MSPAPSSSSVFTRENIDRLRRRKAEQASLAPMPEESRESPFHEAAAVLAWFEVNVTLQPVGRDAVREAAALEQLLTDSICWHEQGPIRRWTLKNDVRKRILRRLATREAIAGALAVNAARPPEPLQRILDSYVLGSPRPLDALNLDELAATLQVLNWLEGTELAGALPHVHEVRRRVEIARLREPFDMLVGTHFRGRARELAVLHDYVGVLPASSLFAVIKRGIRNVLSLHERPPLLIYGPGGMGKSTLLAKFILDHTRSGAPPVAFVYLDFDRTGLIAEEPLTLLIEALRQLALQYPAHAASVQRVVAEWQRKLFEASEANAGPRTVQFRTPLIEQFAFLVRDMNLGDTPLLLVLDTFEEVQYRSRDFVGELWQFLNELQGAVPRIRTVLAGRARVDNARFTTEPLPLANLDQEAAVGFLESQGITDRDAAQALVSVLGGNPLNLKLAAQVLRLETDGLASLIAELNAERRHGKIDDSLIQGQLYRRILRHVHSDDVRRLAHPGLILRRVTAELIEKVLAGPCGVDVSRPGRVRALFDELRKEVSLVTYGLDAAGEPELQHRPDVRRVMLGPLRSDPGEGDKIRMIQEQAIAYYATYDSIEARAEELYHRLLLGQPASQVDPRWREGVEDSLRSAMEELGGDARAYLATRLHLDLQDHRWETESFPVWERYAYDRALNLISLERYEETLEILHQRAERLPDSPLHFLEATALERLGRVWEARHIAREGIARTKNPNDASWLDLHLVVARANEQLQDEPSSPTELTATLAALAERFSDPRVLTLGLHIARAVSRAQANDRDAALVTVRQLLEDLAVRVPDTAIASARPVVEVLLAETFIVDPKVVDRLQARLPRSSGTHGGTQRTSEATATEDSVETLTASLLRASRDADPNVMNRMLAEVVKDRAELASLARRLGIDLGQLGSAKLSVAQIADRFVGHLGEAGRFGELALELYRTRPDVSVLRGLLDEIRAPTRYVPPTPYEALLVSGDRPFVGRPALRSFLRDVAHREGERVHVVTGPPGSGKSYSLQLVRYVQAAARGFDSVTIQDAAYAGVDDPGAIAMAIANQLGWGDRSMPILNPKDPSRYPRELADWIVGQSRRHERAFLVTFDGTDGSIAEPIRQFIRTLASRAVSVRSSLHVALLGMPPGSSQPIDHLDVDVEALTVLEERDVRQFLETLFTHLRRQPSVPIESLARSVLRSAAETAARPPQVNRGVNEALYALMRQLLGA